MKHVVALALSFMLLLVGIVSPCGAMAGGSSESAACSMSDEAGCSHCACCITPANGGDQATVPASVPSPDHSGRSLLAPPPLTLVLTVALDARQESVPLPVSPSSVGSVPLYQRHCLLLI